MDCAKEINEKLLDAEVRVKLDERNETLGYKIRDVQKDKTPYALIVGAKEVENKTVAVRDRTGKQEVMTLEEFITKATKEIREKI
jgi:threonyl-tRNA synthetase